MVLRPCCEAFQPGKEILHADLNVVIQCRDVSVKEDKTNTVVNNVVFLRVYRATDGESLGILTIHLHHTARKIQIQGSALMPDNTTIPIWFLYNILQRQLNELASSQSYDITVINSKIQQLIVENNTATKNCLCKGCNRQIKGKGLVETCPSCNILFHKKCFKNHSCPSNQDTAVPLPKSSSLSISSGGKVTATQTSKVSILHLPNQAYNSKNQSASQNRSNSIVSPQGICPLITNTASSSLNPGATPFMMPSNVPPPKVNQPKGKKVTAKKQATVSQLEFDLEFKTVELNNAKTMIFELETENKRLKQSYTILESRVNLFESEKQKQTGDLHPQNCHQAAPQCESNHVCHRPSSHIKTCCRCQCQDAPKYDGFQMDENVTRAILNIDVKLDALTLEMKKFLQLPSSVSNNGTQHTLTRTPVNREQSHTNPQTNPRRPSEASNNSIDENISDSELGSPLNFNVLTNQTYVAPALQ